MIGLSEIAWNSQNVAVLVFLSGRGRQLQLKADLPFNAKKKTKSLQRLHFCIRRRGCFTSFVDTLSTFDWLFAVIEKMGKNLRILLTSWQIRQYMCNKSLLYALVLIVHGSVRLY